MALSNIGKYRSGFLATSLLKMMQKAAFRSLLSFPRDIYKGINWACFFPILLAKALATKTITSFGILPLTRSG